MNKKVTNIWYIQLGINNQNNLKLKGEFFYNLICEERESSENKTLDDPLMKPLMNPVEDLCGE